MTDPIIAAARDHAADRRAVLVSIAESLSPTQLADAAIDAAALAREDARRAAEERDEIKRALAEARRTIDSMAVYQATQRKLDDARAEADRLAARLDDAEESAETQRRAACNLRDALDRVATAAGVADGSGDEVAERIVAAIDKLRKDRDVALDSANKRSVEIVNLRDALATARRERDEWRATTKNARATSKPESQPAAAVAPAPTKVDRYVVVSRGNIPPGTPPDRLAWFSPAGGSEVRVCKALNDGTIDRGELEWGALELGGAPLNGPFGILDRGEPIGEEG